LENGRQDGQQQHVIHLGDVYFTGAKREYKNNFLHHWPVHYGESFGSFIVCGNHDMYRGGYDYYGTALADPRFAQQAGKSVFALRNANWQFLGIDTAYEEKRLSKGQDQWIKDQLDNAENRRTTILSHHPLWSDYGPEVGEDLRNQIGPILADEQRHIDAWFWGHEHRCAVFKPRNPVDFTSCVGHGGIPSYLTAAESDPYPPNVKYEYRKQHGRGWQPWNTFGFAVLDLDGRNMHVRYIDESGTMHHDEHL
jgi:predicted phosphodiesterase